MKLGGSVLVGAALVAILSVLWGISGSSAGAQVAADPVFVGAGDIVRCSATLDEATAKLIDDGDPETETDILRAGTDDTVFTTGDNAYQSGTASEFNNCYGPSWGRFKDRTKPVPGNHEYLTPGASGYYDYFGAAAGQRDKGYYSYDLGEWHAVALNSMCENVGGCDATSPMVTWLKQDLAANPNACTIAYFHHPLFTSGSVHGNNPKMKPAWQALYAAGADVILSGHSHNYERFAPQNPDGVADPERGIREFVVGTGGGAYHGFGTVKPNSQVRSPGTGIDGVLKLTLHPSGYDWEFVPVAGKTFTDSGSGQCHGAPPSSSDTTAPAVQGPLQDLPTGGTLGTSTIPTKLSWSANDESGVTGYELQQSVNGGSFTRVSLTSATSTAKTLQLQPGSAYLFRVRATDGAGNTSDWKVGPQFLVDAQQESSAAIRYAGSWSQQTLASAYGGALRYATTKGSTAQFDFTGRNVAWVTTKGPDRGKATVSVDGVPVRTVDLYSSTTLPRRILFSQSNLDPLVAHTVTVQVTGTKNSASSGTRVDVDAFVVLR